ncbi:MAG: C10 family peptidase [Prevotellaceae bacterium]|jgi:hypothetical protein|nr:C10 family peptidase [Prevotellaceae bacterium]
MKRINVFLLATMLLASVACSNEENLNDGQLVATNEVQLTDAELDVLYKMRNENNKVGIEEAMQFANDVIGFLDGESAVKSGTARSISSIGTLVSTDMQSVALKSSNDTDVEIPDTVAYIFNFGDEDGYAIVSADTRIEDPILAYTDNGNLSDTIDNPGLILFLEGSEDYIVRSIVDAEQKRDSLISSIVAKLNAENESDTKAIAPRDILLDEQTLRVTTNSVWTTTSFVYPLSLVEWGQGNEYRLWPSAFHEPFWDLVRYKNCTKGTSPAGCNAVAVAHIMSYWKYPSSIDGYTFHWNELNNYTGGASYLSKQHIANAPQYIKTEAARLMERIGANINTTYNCVENGGSSSTLNACVKLLQKYGYKYSYSVMGSPFGLNYDYNTIIASLNKNQPVLVRGDSYKRTKSYLCGLITSSSYSGGHAWVIDGYISRRQTVTTTVELTLRGRIVGRSTSTSYNYANYLHNNWGYSGIDNGYFISGSFNLNRIDLPSNTRASTTTYGEDGNYQYKIIIYPYITR